MKCEGKHQEMSLSGALSGQTPVKTNAGPTLARARKVWVLLADQQSLSKQRLQS